jgi:hypothetical protein
MSRFGTLGTQYLDDAGNPLIDGLIYFYASGTTTKITTYSDINLTIANSNPVVLTGAGRQPNIFFEGTAKAVLTKADYTQIEVRDPVGGVDSAFIPEWDAATIYSIPQIVLGSDNSYYESIVNANQGQNPTGSPAAWTEIKLSKLWNTNETYAALDVVQGSDGLLYSAVIGANLGNNPVTDLVNWKPVTPQGYSLIYTTPAFATDSTIDIVLPSGYSSYVLKLIDVGLSTNTIMYLRTSSDGGATFDVTANDYFYCAASTAATATVLTSSNSVVETKIPLGVFSSTQWSGNIEIFNPSAIASTVIDFKTDTAVSGNAAISTGGGKRVAAAVVDAIRLYLAVGTFNTGVMKLYGVR